MCPQENTSDPGATSSHQFDFRTTTERESCPCSAVHPTAKGKSRTSGEVHVRQLLDPASSTKVHSLDDVLDLAHFQNSAPGDLVHYVDLEDSMETTELKDS